MKTSKHFLQSTTGIFLLALGLSAILVGFTVGGVIVGTEDSGPGVPSFEDENNYDLNKKRQESYDVVPPLQDASQFFPSYPGAPGTLMPTPPTYVDPNMGQQNLPLPPTAYAPYDQSGGGMMTGGPTGGGVPQGGGSPMPPSPMSGSPTGAAPGMPGSPTPGQNLNRLGMADPNYGHFESARLEAALVPHAPAQVNAARNQVLRGGKPFSGYRQPPAYSPYISLLRTEDTLRGINNYYEYVMPIIQQEQTNRNVSQSIHGLQITTRSGYQAIQSIKQRPGNAPVQAGGAQVPTFMNTGSYFGQGQR